MYPSEGQALASPGHCVRNYFLMVSWLLPQAQKVSDDLMQKISAQNRRALDLVAAKCYYYHARVYEFLDKLDVVRRYRGPPTVGPYTAWLWTCGRQEAWGGDM